MSAFLEKFCGYIREHNENIFSVTEIKDGISETAAINGASRAQDVYSIAKLFTVTAIGMLFDGGKIDVDEKVTDILKDEIPVDTEKGWYSVTVDMALRHRIGMPKGFLDIDVKNTCAFGKDLLAYMMRTPLLCEPGTERVYTDGAYYLLSRIVEKRAGMPIDCFLWERLFYPMAFEEAAWSRCPLGHPMGATGLFITSADAAKLGQLYLDGGVYNAQRYLSENWVRTCIEKPYELYPHGGGAYGKGGMYGQKLLIIPDKKRVVSWLGYKANADALVDLALSIE